MKDKIRVIAFDADDTLWENENHFQMFEEQFCDLMNGFGTKQEISHELFVTEMKNLHLYGYGAKGMMLCMIETICKVAAGDGELYAVSEIIRLGQKLLQKPVQLIDGVKDVISQLKDKYHLIVATKGDLLDQERKIRNSGLQDYFARIEIMSDKKSSDYRKVLDSLGCLPQNFLMVGNSVKSDIQPVLELGGYAIHIPYHTTWQHEQTLEDITHHNYLRLECFRDLLECL